MIEQNVSDLIDLTTSGREQKASEVAFAKELEVRREAFQAERYYIRVLCSYAIANRVRLDVILTVMVCIWRYMS